MIVKILLFVVFYIVWVLGALYVVFGLFTSGLSTGVIPFPAIVLYLIVIMIPVLLFNRTMGEPGWVKKVRAEGKQASATVLSVVYTGVRVNRRSIYKVTLRVEPRDEEAFEVSMDDTWFAQPSEGTTVQVSYDPDNHKHVVILDNSATYANGASLNPDLQALYDRESGKTRSQGRNISDELAKLAQMHKNGDLTDAEFERAKQKLLG